MKAPESGNKRNASSQLGYNSLDIQSASPKLFSSQVSDRALTLLR